MCIRYKYTTKSALLNANFLIARTQDDKSRISGQDVLNNIINSFFDKFSTIPIHI